MQGHDFFSVCLHQIVECVIVDISVEENLVFILLVVIVFKTTLSNNEYFKLVICAPLLFVRVFVVLRADLDSQAIFQLDLSLKPILKYML